MLKEKLDCVENSLSAMPSFGFLGLKLAGIDQRPASKVLGESFLFYFSNQYQRAVQVIFYSSEDENFFLVNIINEESQDTFNLSDWLKKNNMFVNADQFKLSNYSGDFDKKIKYLSDEINSIFEDPKLISIVKGDDWEEVAFDWAGMK